MSLESPLFPWSIRYEDTNWRQTNVPGRQYFSNCNLWPINQCSGLSQNFLMKENKIQQKLLECITSHKVQYKNVLFTTEHDLKKKKKFETSCTRDLGPPVRFRTQRLNVFKGPGHPQKLAAPDGLWEPGGRAAGRAWTCLRYTCLCTRAVHFPNGLRRRLQPSGQNSSFLHRP